MIAVILLTLFGTAAFAANTPTFEIAAVNADPGETVDVTVSFKNNPGIASANLKVSYGDMLTLTKVTFNNAAIGGTATPPQNLGNPVTLSWVRPTEGDLTKDTVFATLTFKVADNASAGSTANISLTYNPDDVYNTLENNITFAVQAGGVTCGHGTGTTEVSVDVKEDPARGITSEIVQTLSNNQEVNSFTNTGLDQALAGTPYAGQAAAIKASVQNVETAGDTTTLIFDVTPYVGDTNVSSAINGTVTFLLPLTAEFTAYAKVLHQGDDIKYYEVKFDSNHNPYIKITTTHFSDFIVSNVDKLPDDDGGGSDDGGGGSSGGGGCYVATCVYGSYDCPEVWTLRRFRDETLAQTWYGRLFIHTYYAISPTIVKWFGDTDWFKDMWRGTLDKMVANLNAQGVPNTAYDDIDW